MPAFVHFENLNKSVASHPNAPVFKIPRTEAVSGQAQWVDISYAQFKADIERMSRFWLHKLSSQDIRPRSVVGIWLRGFTYQDVVTIYAVSLAGFIPHLLRFKLPNVQIVLELLAKYQGKVVIHDPAKTTLLLESKTTIQCHVAVDCTSVKEADVEHFPLYELPEACDDDFTFIHITSGSVSGRPKVVPQTNRWMIADQNKTAHMACMGDFDTQDVYLWSGSFSHAMQMNLFQRISRRAACLVQPTRMDFDSHELADMIRKTGLNRIIQFAGVLSHHIEAARNGREPGLFTLLKGMRQVTYGGMPLATDLADWAVSQGIPVNSYFGTTECGQLLVSVIGDRRLEILPTVSHNFVPVGRKLIDGTEYDHLFELRILSDSPDLPVAELRAQDGGWHTGDLFEQVEPGKYLSRGRDDDWIKSQWGERFDTKTIENNVYSTCPDIVASCVVVGNGRPFPALFVEPCSPAAAESMELGDELKREIIKRTDEFNSLRCLHERIQDTRMIKIVPAGSLPRVALKGTVRRSGVEQDFAADLEAMYSSMPVEKIFASVFRTPRVETTVN